MKLRHLAEALAPTSDEDQDGFLDAAALSDPKSTSVSHIAIQVLDGKQI